VKRAIRPIDSRGEVEQHQVGCPAVCPIPRCARLTVHALLCTLREPAAARHTGAVTDGTAGDEARWRAALSPERYAVMRQAATEPPFTGRYNDCDTPGRYRCGACGAELFDSGAKFHSGTGWPSFTAPVADGAVVLEPDGTCGMVRTVVRTEVKCRHCGSHLGHVFDDGPAPTGKRYYRNSVALDPETRGDPS